MPEPVSVEQARLHARLDGSVTDEEVNDLIRRARGWVETFTGLILTQRRVVQSFDHFGQVRLSAWPIDADPAVEIEYRDRTGVAKTLSDGWLYADARPAEVYPAIGAAWPSTAENRRGAVKVGVNAGYALPADVPAQLVQAMLVLIAAFYDDRDGGEVLARAEAAATSLCQPFRLWSV